MIYKSSKSILCEVSPIMRQIICIESLGVDIVVAAVGKNLNEANLQTYTTTGNIFRSAEYTEALRNDIVKAVCDGK